MLSVFSSVRDLFKSFALLEILLFVFLLVDFKSSLFGILDLVRYTIWKYFLSFCGLSLHFFMVSFEVQKSLILMKCNLSVSFCCSCLSVI